MTTPRFTDDEIDALGERLRGNITVADRTLYESFKGELDLLRHSLEDQLRRLAPGAVISSRTKRVETVAAKLRRRSDLRLSQVTDLAGCRIVVSGQANQRAVVERLLATYHVLQVDDKSDSPKFGYRAVHLDVRHQGKLVEIQVQTGNQHLWQMVSELSAGYDVSIKYGGGLPEVSQALQELSELAWRCDLDGTDLPNADIDRVRSVILFAHSG